MPPLLIITAQLLSVVAFLTYGIACFFSERLTAEFKRWGLEPIRKITGALEVLGALGLMVGFVDPTIRTLSAAGLTLMMGGAVIVRAKVGDRLVLWVPAVILFGINLCIALW